MFFTNTSLRYPIIVHRMAFLISKDIQSSISLEVVTIFLHGLRRCSTRIQESGLLLASKGEKKSATVKMNSNRLWTKG